jgi:hypothetical protein
LWITGIAIYSTTISATIIMQTDCHHPYSQTLWKDISAVLVTVAVGCFFFLTSGIFGEAAENMTVRIADIAVPRPPQTVAIVREPPIFFPEPLCMAPEEAWASLDTRAFDDLSIIPDRLPPRKQIPFHGIIIKAAGRYQVDPYLIRAIIFAESGYNPKAKSRRGARGLMQLMPSTARSLGVQDIYDPAQNIDGGVRYFKLLLDRFDGNVQLALAAYNAGSRHVRNYEGIPPFKATKHYIKKVLKFQKKFKMESPAASRRLA